MVLFDVAHAVSLYFLPSCLRKMGIDWKLYKLDKIANIKRNL